jgi:cytochrome c biogenesis protein CcmG, thiol:disulfide interchange protein DsbE
MATKPTTPTPARGAKKPGGGINPLVLIGGIVAVVVVVFVVALVLTGGDDDTSSTSGLTFAPGADIREFQGVVVDGDALPKAPEGGGDTAIGADAPGMSGFGFDGTPINIVPGDGEPYMLVYLAHWCPYCNSEVPELIEWYESGRVPADLRVVAVATGTDQNAPNYPPSRWLVDFGWPWEAMADSPSFVARDTYGLSGYPFIVIVDGDGKVVLRTSGEKSADVVDQMVRDALGLSGDSGADTTVATDTTDKNVTPLTDAPTATEAP